MPRASPVSHRMVLVTRLMALPASMMARACCRRTSRSYHGRAALRRRRPKALRKSWVSADLDLGSPSGNVISRSR